MGNFNQIDLRRNNNFHECIPLGCVSTAAVAATRCRYWEGVPTLSWRQSPPPETDPLLEATFPPESRPLTPVNRMTDASENITFPCGRKVDPVQPRWSLSSVPEFRRRPPPNAIPVVADPVPFYLYLQCLCLRSIYI